MDAHRRTLIALVAVAFVPLLTRAGLREGVRLEAAGETINVEIGHLVPCALDWNGDGAKDLIVGQFSGGRVRLYLNRGSDAGPKFGASAFLKAGGKEIRLDAG